MVLICKKRRIDFAMVEVPKLEPSNEISGRRRKRRGTEFIETLQEKPNSCLDKNNSMKINMVQTNMHLANAKQQKSQQRDQLFTSTIMNMNDECSNDFSIGNIMDKKCNNIPSKYVNEAPIPTLMPRHIKSTLSSSLRYLSNPNKLFLVMIFLLTIHTAASVQLEASVSQNGVRGTITFTQTLSEEGGKKAVQIRANFSVTDSSYAGEYSWGIYDFPIDYSRGPDSCHSRNIGRRPTTNFDTLLGKLVIGMVPDDEDHADAFPADSAEAALEGEDEHKRTTKKPTTIIQTFTLEDIELSGEDGIWGHSFVLEGPSKTRICATIDIANHKPNSKYTSIAAEARFNSPVAGSVWFFMLENKQTGEVDTKIFTNLFHTGENPKSTDNVWDLYITDILDTATDIQGQRSGGGCDFLQKRYNPNSSNGEGCSQDAPEKCRGGDLNGKFGKLRIGKRESMFTKKYYTDVHLRHLKSDLEGPLSIFLVVHDSEHSDSFFSCTQVNLLQPKMASATFMHEGIEGEMVFQQNSPFHPVISSVRLEGLGEGAGSFHVHKFPVPPKRNEDDSVCGRTGGHFNPYNVDSSSAPKAGTGTFDKYEVGDLSGKYGNLKGIDHLQEKLVDPNLSLFGKYSIVGRSIVIHKTPIPRRWVCSNIVEMHVDLVTAVATFTYPIVGKIIFRQNANNPYDDTSIFIESLVYSDGTKNDTIDHKWHVHVDVPGTDFYNWTGRCLSAGRHYNPYRVNLDSSVYSECVNEHNHMRCEVGDLVNKHRTLKVSGKKRDAKNTMAFFVDPNLPLSGPNTIIGRSIVIHDKNAPEHRGNRMACVAIRRHYRHKAVVRDWFGNGIKPPIKGRLVFLQESPYDMTHTKISLHGMKGIANKYHVHMVPVRSQLEFPCTGDAVGGHFNPWKYEFTAESPKPSKGTPDQYEVGDLSGKYGLLRDMEDMRGVYNDTNLPLYGQNSIVGRSIVVHKKEKGARWACASIGWGFSPSEAKEVRAIASFHHPDGYVWGYIRFRQVIYYDGSKSDTSMEVRLKYPGKTNTKTTRNHDWSIYVSPVGHDAAVEFLTARCSAAGYRWNPTHIHLANPNDMGFYGEECGSDLPLRCMVGDLSGKLGRLAVGGRAYVVNDVNLPLDPGDGNWFNTAIGKSIIIHGPDGAPERMACANIEKEKVYFLYHRNSLKVLFKSFFFQYL